MTVSSIVGWVLLGVLFFWGIGAYNRLVRLRAAVGKAFAALDRLLLQQLVWVQGCLPESMRGGLQTTPGELQDAATAAWARLAAASEQFTLALAQARLQPAESTSIEALVLARTAWHIAWREALAEEGPISAMQPSAERMLAKWNRLQHQEQPLVAAFNEAVDQHNRSVAQFPASLLARMWGHRPAARLLAPDKSGR